MPIAAAIRTAGPTVPVRRGASTQRTTAIPAKRAGRPAGPARRSIHSAEVLAPAHPRHAHSGTRGNQSPYHETYKGNAPSPVRRSPRHGQRFCWTCRYRYEVHRSYVQADLEMKRKALDSPNGPQPTQAPTPRLSSSLIEWLEALLRNISTKMPAR